jgi:hypothetical protein
MARSLERSPLPVPEDALAGVDPEAPRRSRRRRRPADDGGRPGRRLGAKGWALVAETLLLVAGLVALAVTQPWRSTSRPAASTAAAATTPAATSVPPAPASSTLAGVPGPPVLGPGGPQSLFPSDVPDPFILRVGSLYYMYATQPWQDATNVPLRVSSDLIRWRSLGDAMPTVPAWADSGRTWAPSVLARPHEYVMYFTAEHYYSRRQCIGLATSPTPSGPFIPSRSILECQLVGHGGSIDPQVFVDNDGTPYLLWKSDDNAIHLPSTLWAAKLSPDGLSLASQPVPMIHDDVPWEHYTIEAPAMVHAAGHYWLFYSGSWLGSSSYALGYALCAGPLGPCQEQTTEGPWYASGPDRLGPGEESFFTDAYGNVWIAYDAWSPAGVGYLNGYVRAPHIELVRFHPNAPPTVSPEAVAIAANPKGGFYVLTADGDVLAENGAPSFGSPRLGTAPARSIAVMPDGQGYAVLDAFGGVSLFGSAVSLNIDASIYWPNQDIARSIVITPSGQGYAVLDGDGGIHPTGDAPPAPAAPLWPGHDIARALVITPDGKGYAVLSGYGGIATTGDAPPGPAADFWPGSDVARGLVITPSGRGYAVLDDLGDFRTTGDATAVPVEFHPIGTWVGLAIRSQGGYDVLRSDSFASPWLTTPGPPVQGPAAAPPTTAAR